MNEPDRSHHYPLWCIDKGDKDDESRYRGPFETEQLATAKLDELRADDCGQYKAATIRRCRRLRPREVFPGSMPDSIVEEADDNLGGGGWDGPTQAWAHWDDSMLDFDGDDRLFWAWADAHVRVDAHVCEGDEDPGEAPWEWTDGGALDLAELPRRIAEALHGGPDHGWDFADLPARAQAIAESNTKRGEDMDCVLSDLRDARTKLERMFSHLRGENDDAIDKAPPGSQIAHWRDACYLIDSIIGEGIAEQVIDDVQGEAFAGAPMASRVREGS